MMEVLVKLDPVTRPEQTELVAKRLEHVEEIEILREDVWVRNDRVLALELPGLLYAKASALVVGEVPLESLLILPHLAVPRGAGRLIRSQFGQFGKSSGKDTGNGRPIQIRLGPHPGSFAAHILPDRDERGRPEVPNGLSLCKIHHGAYDTEILGVDPDFKVHIRGDVLDETDGPMLMHGLQELHGSRIGLPKGRAPAAQPGTIWRSGSDGLGLRQASSALE